MTGGDSLNRLALSATVHCLTGCAIGEVLGMVLGGIRGWSTPTTILVSILLAFLFGYSLTMRPLLGSGLSLARSARLALMADTVSIGVMELVDNLVMVLILGAMAASPASGRFWISLGFSLVLAGVAAYPVNRWLIARGRGHAVVHHHHAH